MADESLSFCMVTTFYPPYHFGGDALYVYRLSDALARRGHRVTVLHAPSAHRALGGRRRSESFPHHPNVRVVALDSSTASPVATYLTGRPLLKRRRLSEVFAHERFDVVHFHNVSLAGGPGVLAYGSGIKLYTIHEHWLICPMHTLWKFNQRLCEKPECIPCSLAYRRPPQLWRYTNLMEREVEHVDLFLAPSKFTLQMHRSRGFTRPIQHLRHFLPAPSGPARRSETAARRPYFLYVGRLEEIKGVHTLIERFRTYRDADLLIAGDGTQEAKLRRQAQGLDHVGFLGYADAETLHSLYTDAVAVIVPSIGYEVSSFVALEAFAHGTPAVVRDLGGLGELIEESGAGFVYRNDAELLSALDTLQKDQTERSRLGELARSAFQTLWSEKAHLAAYLAILAELAS